MITSVKTSMFKCVVFAGAILFTSFTFAEPPTRKSPQATLADFTGLAAGVTFQEIVRRAGPPDDEVGCCMYVYRYRLADGSVVLVSTLDCKRVDFVSHKVGDVETILLTSDD